MDAGWGMDESCAMGTLHASLTCTHAGVGWELGASKSRARVDCGTCMCFRRWPAPLCAHRAAISPSRALVVVGAGTGVRARAHLVRAQQEGSQHLVLEGGQRGVAACRPGERTRSQGRVDTGYS